MSDLCVFDALLGGQLEVAGFPAAARRVLSRLHVT